MTTSGHDSKQRTDMQNRYTNAATTIAALPAGANTLLAYLNAERALLQTAVTKEGGAFLS